MAIAAICLIISFILHSLFVQFFLTSPDLMKQFPGCSYVILFLKPNQSSSYIDFTSRYH